MRFKTATQWKHKVFIIRRSNAGAKWTHWKAKVLPYSFLAVRKRASLAGGLLSSRNWWEVCMNFSCYHNEIIKRERDRQKRRKQKVSMIYQITQCSSKQKEGRMSDWFPTLLRGSLTMWDRLLEIILQKERKKEQYWFFTSTWQKKIHTM